MKKLLVIIAAAAAVMLSVSASAKEVSVSRLGESVEQLAPYSSETGQSVIRLTKDRSVKNRLIIAEEEMLVVPSGSTLSLNDGCEVGGTLFVESGARLLVKSGKLEINGSVVNDGTLSIGKKSGLKINGGGMLYTSHKGTLKSSASLISVSENATAVCLGKSSISGCLENAKTALCPNAVSGVKISFGYGLDGIFASQTLTAEEALTVAASDYFDLSEPPLGSNDMLTILFDNGCAVKYLICVYDNSDRIAAINGAQLSAALRLM